MQFEMMFKLKLFPCAFAWMVLFMHVGNAEVGVLKNKKIIGFGGGLAIGGVPDPVSLQKHITELEQHLPLDGIILSVNPTVDGQYLYFPDLFFGNYSLSLDVFQPLIEQLKAIPFRRFTDNFLRLNVVPGDVDWFDDDAWATIIAKGRIAASVAKEGGLKGILLDTEQYVGQPFYYKQQKYRDRIKFNEYQQRARQRGRELMGEFTLIYPNITVLLTSAHSVVVGEGLFRQALKKAKYGLLPAFIDGMLEMSEKATVIDIFELSYGYKTHRQFSQARRKIKVEATKLSLAPQLYRMKMKAGFGLWLAYGGKWNCEQVMKNYFTPLDFEHALHYALRNSDGYVWIYFGEIQLLKGDVTADYVKAMQRVKENDYPE